MAREILGKPTTIQATLGYSTGTTYYTVVEGTMVYIGTDGASVANRAIPVTDISGQIPIGAVYKLDTDFVEDYGKGQVAIATFPFMMRVAATDCVTGALPAASGLVYIADAETFSNANQNTATESYGLCLEVDTANDKPYLLLMLGPQSLNV